MARKLNLVLDEFPIELAQTKIDRDKLFGKIDSVALDPRGGRLTKGYLDEWGSVVIDTCRHGLSGRAVRVVKSRQGGAGECRAYLESWSAQPAAPWFYAII